MAEEKPKGLPIDEALMREGALMPAVYVNKMRLEITESLQVKICFAEEHNLAATVVGRTAVIMSVENAAALSELINKFVQKIPVGSKMQ